VSDPTGAITHLVFPASEVKNEVDLEFRLPPLVMRMMEVYLSRARPLQTKLGNDYLFPGVGLRHLCRRQLSLRIAAETTRVLGVRVTAHQFRHLIGFLYLRENPGGHEVVRRFLGHKRIETTIKYYAGMEQSAAVEHFDRFIEARRQKIASTNHKRGRKPPGPRRPPTSPAKQRGPKR
jgi:integrase